MNKGVLGYPQPTERKPESLGMFCNALPNRQANHNPQGEASTVSPTQNQLVLFPQFIGREVLVDGFVGKTGTGAASNLVRLGVYLVGSATLDLYIDGGTQDFSSSNVNYVRTIPDTVIPFGRIWMAYVLQGGTGSSGSAARNVGTESNSWSTWSPGNDGTFGGNPSVDQVSNFTLSSISGGLPAQIPIATLTQSSSGVMFIGLRLSRRWQG